MGSNHRRLSRRFYSPLAPAKSPPADQHGRASRCDFTPPPSAMRPWAPNFGAEKSTDRGRKIHGRNGGSGYADRPARFLPSDLRFYDACSSSPSPSSAGSGWESWVPRASLIRLLAALACPSMQCAWTFSRAATPCPAGYLGRGHPRVLRQGHRRVPQVIGPTAERRRAVGGGKCPFPGLGPHRAVGRVRRRRDLVTGTAKGLW